MKTMLTHRQRTKCVLLRVSGRTVREISFLLKVPAQAIKEYLDGCPSTELHTKENGR